MGWVRAGCQGLASGVHTEDDLAKEADDGHGDGAGAGPQPPRVPHARDDPADVVAHGRGWRSHTLTTINYNDMLTE